MAGKRKGITEKMVTKDSDEGLKPHRAKKKNLDKDVLHTEKEQWDGKGNKRKRPVPKEEKKRKQLKMDEETKSETRLSLKEQKDRKKQRVGKEANSDTGLDGDDSDTAATTSEGRRYDQDDEDDDRDSTSQKDQADEDEPMDCEEETTVDLISDISLPTSMLKPEGSKTQQGYSTDFQSVEQHSTRGRRKKPTVKRDRAVFDEADAASLKTAHNIRMTGGEMSYLSSYNDSERISPRMSTGKTSGTRSSYLDFHPTLSQRRSQPQLQDKAKLIEEWIFPPQNSANVKTNKTYINSWYSRKNRVERASSPKRKDSSSTFDRYTKSCVYLACLLLFTFFVGALIVSTLKMDVAQNILQTVRDVGVSSFSSGCEKRKRSDRFDVLMQEQDILHQQYPTLMDSTVSVIAGASYDHVDGHQELVRPVVLLLVGKQGGKSTVNDVAASVAKMYANVFSPKRYELDVVRISGTDLEKFTSDEVRKHVHTHIEEGFKDCANVILVTDLDRLPPCSAILFHGYCDNDGAPYKDAVIIFTMTLGTELPEDTQALDVEKAVQVQLDKAWSKCPEEFSSAKLVAMHSRVANNIVII